MPASAKGVRVTDEQRVYGDMCPHCGRSGVRRFGECTSCGRPVCDHCGSVQFIQGRREPIHRECLRRGGGSFKMIKIVR